MKIYHYTKGMKLKSIFADGFIATEQKRTTNLDTRFFTDLAWFTSKKTFPITALPYIPSIPSTNLSLQMRIKNMPTDFSAVASLVGGLWRFGFDSESFDFERWHWSNSRNKNPHKDLLGSLERVANKVGDDSRAFWISEVDVPLRNFTLECFCTKTGLWIAVDPESFRINNSIDGKGGYAIHVHPLAA